MDLHEGGKVILRKAEKEFSPLNKSDSIRIIREAADEGEMLTGLLYIDENTPDFTEMENTVKKPLNEIPFGDLCPGSKTLTSLQKNYK